MTSTTTTTVYIVGHNLIGYMPDNDPEMALDIASARGMLEYDLEEALDFHTDSGLHGADPDEDAAAAEAEAALVDLASISDEDLTGGACYFVGNYSYWINADVLSDDNDPFGQLRSDAAGGDATLDGGPFDRQAIGCEHCDAAFATAAGADQHEADCHAEVTI